MSDEEKTTFEDLGEDGFEMTQDQEDKILDLLVGLSVSMSVPQFASSETVGSVINGELAGFEGVALGFFDIEKDRFKDKLKDSLEENKAHLRQKVAQINALSSVREQFTGDRDIEGAEVHTIEAEDEEDALRQINSLLSSGEPEPDFGNLRYALVDDDGELVSRTIFDDFDNAEDQREELGPEGVNVTEVMI